MSIYKCPKCGYVAKIDTEHNKVEVTLPQGETRFPKHPGCELAKPLSTIDLSKLQKVS